MSDDLAKALAADRRARQRAADARAALRAAVAASEMTEADLARVCGVGRGTIREWRGKPKAR